MKQLHYFIALSLPEEMKNYLNEKIKELKSIYQFKNWVHKEDLHLTLAFLGASEEEILQKCIKEVEEALSTVPPFSIYASHFDTFGLSERPRIFFCEPNKVEQLNLLQQKVYHICNENGYRLDEKAFHPHITIARKYVSEEVFTERDLLNCNELISEEMKFTINKVSLFETHMDKLPKYKEMKTIHLNE